MSQHLQNHALEREVIGGLIVGWRIGYTDQCDDALVALQPDDFTLAPYARLFVAIREMRNSGEAIDLLTVTNRCGEMEFATVAQIASDANLTGAMASHCKLLAAAGERRRRVMAMQQAISHLSHGQDDDAEQALAAAASSDRADAGRVSWVRLGDQLRPVVEGIERRMRSADPIVGLKTGIRELDEVLLGLRSELVVLAARPGLGKTALALQLIMAAAKSGNVLMFSLEMPSEQLTERALSYQSGVSGTTMRNPIGLTPTDFAKLSDALRDLQHLPVDIIDLPGVTAMQVLGHAKQYARHHGKKPALVVLDYLQLLKVAKAEKRTEAVGDACRTVRLMARTLGVPVLLLSQLNRNVEGSPRRPVNADLRDSGEIEQEADRIIMLHRPEPENPYTEVLITKNRHGETAADGRIAMVMTGAGLVSTTRKEPSSPHKPFSARRFGGAGRATEEA